jgi:hypothetical protein
MAATSSAFSPKTFADFDRLFPNEDAAKAVGLSLRQVQRWRSRWAAGDFSI